MEKIRAMTPEFLEAEPQQAADYRSARNATMHARAAENISALQLDC